VLAVRASIPSNPAKGRRRNNMAVSPQQLAHRTNGAEIHQAVQDWIERIDDHVNNASEYGNVTIPLGKYKMPELVYEMLRGIYMNEGWATLRKHCDGSVTLEAPVMPLEDYVT
jgi:hypothetical protein